MNNKELFSDYTEAVDESTSPYYRLRCAGIGTWAWNVQSGEARFDRACAEIVGFTLDELQPLSITTFSRLLHPDDKALVAQKLQRHFDGSDSNYEVEVRMLHKDGHWVNILDRGKVLIRDEQGEPLWMFGAHLDISERWGSLDRQDHAIFKRLNVLMNPLSDYVYQFRLRPDGSAHFPFATAAIQEIYGCTPEQILDDAELVFNAMHPDDRACIQQSILASANNLSVWRERYRVNHPTKGLIWVKGKASPVREQDGGILWHGYFQDVTEDQLQRDQLRLAARVFSSSQEGIIISDQDNRILDVNEAFERITGYGREEVLGQNPAILRSGQHSENFFKSMWKAITERGRWYGEIWNKRKDGSIYAELLSIEVVHDASGEIKNYIAIFTDISQLKELQTELLRVAHYDALTGLPNRRLMDERIMQATEYTNRHGGLFAVCLLDLDNFNQINDLYGIETGDKVLVHVANAIRAVLRGQDTVARSNGDEFILLLTEQKGRESLLELIKRVQDAMRMPMTIAAIELRLTASIGIAIYPELPRTPEELLRYADQAMYRAKQMGRNQYCFFDSTEDQVSHERQIKLREVEEALRNDSFVLHYQPKIDLRESSVCSVEALIRWPQAAGKMRMPDEFIPFVIGFPVELLLGQWVMSRAIAQYSRWHQEGLDIMVSLNISPDHFLSPDFVAQLRAVLGLHKIAHPEHIVLEILETSSIADFNRMRECVVECKKLGVRTSLDDFGTGYSSMTYMRQLPVDELKIDKSFVISMLDDEEDRNIVEAIIALGHAFGRIVIAEGVETEQHMQKLREMGCDVAQGYGIAKPMPAQEVPAWIRSWRSQLAKE